MTESHILWAHQTRIYASALKPNLIRNSATVWQQRQMALQLNALIYNVHLKMCFNLDAFHVQTAFKIYEYVRNGQVEWSESECVCACESDT